MPFATWEETSSILNSTNLAHLGQSGRVGHVEDAMSLFAAPLMIQQGERGIKLQWEALEIASESQPNLRLHNTSSPFQMSLHLLSPFISGHPSWVH